MKSYSQHQYVFGVDDHALIPAGDVSQSWDILPGVSWFAWVPQPGGIRVTRTRHNSIIRCVPLILNEAAILQGTIKYIDQAGGEGVARPILFTGP